MLLLNKFYIKERWIIVQKENNQNEITKDSIETVNKTEKIEEKNQKSKKEEEKSY